ncbi:transmembrane protein 65 isoform X1 [Phlebotomus argentipes]|uniref:transmembrane protein 65 isoform X1 n=1 Tax=Phlebotomus argentipes TaxID=94469 RepID=UPI002892F44C|nr:transmembrane protein 65 isoform X1 [Phlebotomus argentipes]
MSCNKSFCFLLRCGQTSRLLTRSASKTLGALGRMAGSGWQMPGNSVTHRWIGSDAARNLSAEEASEFVDNLSADERENLKNALAQYESSSRRKFEGPQLGTARWRSGRMRRISPDATGRTGDEIGSHCKLPEDYLQKKLEEVKSPPTSSQKMQLVLVNGLPFIGFGFLDNFMMIVCGDYIEQTLGGYMCLSTMAAAGLGNTISDVAGLGSAVYVERLCESLGFKVPPLSKFQMEMKESRRSASLGRILGITIGCLIGMVPLLFIDTEKKHDEVKTDGKDH